ncbi:hypothetical protein KIN20_011333 [Parelaphostrongylus tenuis]|uniref:Uncharacterized protein n=1 Tax=Parelaphostrongylus tenuis TaxID=148309 RepID=A0AAD5QJK1_PARTN|nr:hypothetical protein KIN20_011333 [Parelaphostrongylus tenuis]
MYKMNNGNENNRNGSETANAPRKEEDQVVEMLDEKDSDVLTDRHNHLHVVAGKPMEVWELKEV